MRDRLISYLAAVFLNLALVGPFEPSPRIWRLSRPGIAQLFDGARVIAVRETQERSGVRIGLLLENRLHLLAADPQERLFPLTYRWDRSEPAVAVLN